MPRLKYNIKLTITLALCLLMAAEWGMGQSPNFDRISINDGLSLSSVYCIYQDSKGYMWFATEDGLNRYNGQNFTIYNHTPGDPQSLSCKWIESIVEDEKGIIWLGSRQGLTRLDPRREKITRYFNDAVSSIRLPGDTIMTLLSHAGYIWAGTNNGLIRIDVHTLTSELIKTECGRTGEILSMMPAGENKIWIGAENGLYLLEISGSTARCMARNNIHGSVHSLLLDKEVLWVGLEDQFMRYSIDTDSCQSIKFPYPVNNLRSPVEEIRQDTSGALWLNTSKALFVWSDGRLESIVETPLETPSLAIRQVKPLEMDHEGRLWLGTFGNGIWMIDPSTRQVTNIRHDASKPKSLSDNTVNCIYLDRANGMWVGTFGAGISTYNPNSNIVETLQHNAFDENSLSDSFVWSIQEDKNRQVWIGTNNRGISIYNPETSTFSFLEHDPNDPNSLAAGAVREIFCSAGNEIWTGTDGGGLSLYDMEKKRFIHYTNDPDDPFSISSNSVRTIYQDSTGTFWIGTRNGLNRFNSETGRFIRYLNDPEDSTTISNNFIYSAIYMDRHGDLWVGTYGGGLNKMDTKTGTFERYMFDLDDPDGISDNIVFSIYEDKKGYFWIGTNSGLNLFNPSAGQFKRFGIEDGLPNDVIYGILPDEMNNLWLSTNKGISRLDMTKYQFKNFDVLDGLQSNEFNGGAYHKGESGYLYFGGVYGLNIIDPAKILPVDNHAELVISRLEILSKEVLILKDEMMVDTGNLKNELIETAQGYYLSEHVSYLDEIRLNYKQRFFSIEFAALNHHIPEKLNYRYRMSNLEDHWNYAGTRNYVTYANMKPGNYVFEVDAINQDGFRAERPASLRIVITPPFWRSFWFTLLMSALMVFIIVFVYRYLLNQRTNKILTEQNEQIKQANQQLRISENNLRELNATKDMFFSIISHDLKNPFASVLSISELLDKNFETADMDDIKHGLNKINKTNKHIYELLENLLTWSKSQRGKIEMTRVVFNLNTVIETNLNILRLAAFKKNIELINHLSSQLLAFGDREMVSTIFRNLTNNAIKFTPEGKRIDIHAYRENAHVIVEVRDEGVGIAPEKIPKLFNIEDKYKSDGTAGEKGTGLGLIICKDFVEMNEGVIEVESSPGKGSVFRFTLPAREQGEQE
jgi:signal transduction histidine kinase/ligand-binding sensor domain-containing protein